MGLSGITQNFKEAEGVKGSIIFGSKKNYELDYYIYFREDGF